MSYILNTEEDIKEMLKTIGLNSIEELYNHLPERIRLKEPLNLEKGLSEQELKKLLKDLSKKNIQLSEFNSFLGAGCYDHYIPSAVNFISSLPEFLTSYTPYQSECSQGVLKAIYEYQSYICLLTGLEISNASMLDGASAFAEAVLMALRITKRNKVIVSNSIHPEYLKTLETYLSGFDFRIEKVDFNSSASVNFDYLESVIDLDTACVAFQSPNFFGYIEKVENISKLAHSKSALSLMVTNPLSLAILKEPAQDGVDIVCGDGQVLGGGLNLGGSSFGFLATKMDFVRQLPGRIVGKTLDKEGKVSYCLTLQAREQHIRREKATSNICSNSSLNAIKAAIYLSLMGKDGFYNVALYSLNLASYLYEQLNQIKEISFPFSSYFFNEFVWKIKNAKKLINRLYKKKIIAGFYLGNLYPQLKDCILSCCTEKKTKNDIDSFILALKEVLYG